LAAFPDKVDNSPVFFASLQVREIQISQFTPPQTTAKQNGEDCPIPFAFESVVSWRLPQLTAAQIQREQEPQVFILDSS
jgi:hypothetical protein